MVISYITGDIFILTPPKQSLKAWIPFWDCVGILFEFQNSDVDEYEDWRLYWVAGITLLRTIGHVLAKSDSTTSEKHKTEIESLWDIWKTDRDENCIFWEFIEKERNNLLKTYTFGAKLAQDNRGYFVEFANGEDAFELFREAIYRWRHQLMTLEERV
jgi:hypothetical protein